MIWRSGNAFVIVLVLLGLKLLDVFNNCGSFNLGSISGRHVSVYYRLDHNMKSIDKRRSFPVLNKDGDEKQSHHLSLVALE